MYQNSGVLWINVLFTVCVLFLVMCGSCMCLVLCWCVSVFRVYNAWRGLGSKLFFVLVH